MNRVSVSTEQSWYRALFENAPVGMWDEDFSALKLHLESLPITTPQELHDYLRASDEALMECVRHVRVRNVNRAALRFYGASTEKELMGLLPSLFDEGARRIFVDEVCALWGGAPAFSADYVTATLSGELRLVQINVSLLPTPENDWSRVVVTFTDLTERRRLEQALERANTALRGVNEGLEQFAYAAAHDLKEPLRTIKLHAELLGRISQQPQDSRERMAIGYIIDNVSQLSVLISDLLSFAKALEPPDLTSLSAADSDAVLKEVLDTLKAQIEKTGAEFEIGPLLPAPILPGHLRQILQNLISNAMNYCPPSRAPRISITIANSGGRLEFAVADNGSGISPEHRQEIFGVFKRLHGDQIPGTGIGLALCKRLVEHYGGKIWVEPVEPEGSVFRFTLPLSA